MTNTLNNLKLDLYNYLTDKQNFIKNENILSKKSSITQVGKYFEKWSSLSKEQKLERLESFSIYYIDKHLIESPILPLSLSADLMKILDIIRQEAGIVFPNHD